jgi:hypothetical protein
MTVVNTGFVLNERIVPFNPELTINGKDHYLKQKLLIKSPTPFNKLNTFLIHNPTLLCVIFLPTHEK